MIALIDYGAGNTSSVANILYRNNTKFIITKEIHEIKKSNKIILPGVANFSYCIKRLKETRLDEIIIEEVVIKKKLFLGICSGMQLLGTFSEEGNSYGLNIIQGKIKSMKKNGFKIVPHVGWNKIYHKNNEILKDIPSQTRFYFCHSYFFEPDEPQDIMTQTNYDKKFCSGINRKNIFGIQFHPEKSLKSGQILMKNFSNL